MAETQPPYLKLPNELWDVIFSYGFVQKDFLALSTLSKAFNKVVEPSLYSSFTWIPHPCVALPVLSSLNNRDIRPLTRSKRRNGTELPLGFFSHQKPYLFLKALLESPRRAGYVEKVRVLAPLSDSGLFWDSYQARECGFSNANLETCKKTIDLLPFELHSYWLDGLYRGKLDVILGLLLLQLTGLTSVDIRLRDASTIGNPVFDALSSTFNGRPNHYRYPNIRSVNLSIDRKGGAPVRNYYAVHEDDICHAFYPVPSIFEFKKLETLSLTCCSPGNFWRNKLSTASNLKKVTLRNGVINEHILKTFLAATPHLEELDCELVYDDDAQQRLDCDVLKSALSLVQNTLSRLVLDISVVYGQDWNPIPWDVQNFMGSMKDFQQLRYLDIPITLYATEIVAASQAASSMPFKDRKIDPWGERMPDGLEWFGIRLGGLGTVIYGIQSEVERCVEVYLRMNPGVKRIVQDLGAGDDEDEVDLEELFSRS
ncbi:hypothetical protein BKA65DRAFT_294413 [Rhexocercosporidium sp. MPI-PUGE-AT-0058]|nr:hypothetical protein BKA65DRAFT_294413 [Rhexocercosporidium sp. MPI-PUGE-AT-0058]